MRSILLASTALVLAGPAFAADMPLKAPAPAAVRPAPQFSWTGCYLGGHVGVGWERTDISDPTGTLVAPAGSSVRIDSGPGVVGGGQIGCDYQFATNWLLGAAGDFSWTSIDGQANDPFFSGKNPGPIVVGAKTEWLASATARLGYVWDHLMVYGKGGVAWAHSKLDIGNLTGWGANSPFGLCTSGGLFVACSPSGSDTRAGWTAGAGIEWAFTPAWSAGVEFDHYDFGSRSVTLVDANAAASHTTGSINVDNQRIEAVKFLLNFRPFR